MGHLFDKGPAENSSPDVAASQRGAPRLRVPHRDQVEMHWAALDELLEPDHRARTVWAAAAGLSLDDWLQSIQAVQGSVGRDATDPRLLVALWVYATLEGVGSARGAGSLVSRARGVPLAVRPRHGELSPAGGLPVSRGRGLGPAADADRRCARWPKGL